jgi:hypothetical protein
VDDQADLLGHVLVSRISKVIRTRDYLQHVEVEGVVASEVVGPIVDLSCVLCELLRPVWLPLLSPLPPAADTQVGRRRDRAGLNWSKVFPQ